MIVFLHNGIGVQEWWNFRIDPVAYLLNMVKIFHEEFKTTYFMRRPFVHALHLTEIADHITFIKFFKSGIVQTHNGYLQFIRQLIGVFLRKKSRDAIAHSDQ